MKPVFFICTGLLFLQVAITSALASFNFMIETTAEAQTFKFRVFNAVNFEVSWDGGTTWETPVTQNDLLLSHDYGDEGDHTICVKGQAARIAFGLTDCTPALLKDVTSALSPGITGVNSAEKMFMNCTQITTFTCSTWFDEARRMF